MSGGRVDAILGSMDFLLDDLVVDLAFNPDEPRDSNGRWSDEPGSHAAFVRFAQSLRNKTMADGGPKRTQMPQLSGVPIAGSKADKIPHEPGQEVDLVDQFKKELIASGVKVTETEVPADFLRPTQDQLVEGKVIGIAKFMETAPADASVFESIFVTKDGHVIDGHHRWAGQVVRDEIDGKPHRKMKVRMVDLSIEEALKRANEFMSEWGLPKAGNRVGTTISTFAKPTNLSVEDFLDDLIDLAITPGGRQGDASSLAKPGYHGPRRLSDYEREIAHALMRKGHSKSKAIRMARGLLNKAAATGRWGNRGKASLAVRAGAVASRAQRKTF